MYIIIFDGRFNIIEIDNIEDYDFFFTNFTDAINVCYKANAILGIRGINEAYKFLNNV